MGKKIKKDILKQIENILKDYNELKATFEPLEYLNLLGKDQDEITKINGLITKIKALISSNFDEDAPFYKQVELHSKDRSGMCGRSELSMVIADLKVINNELLQKFKSIKESKRIKASIKRLFVFFKKNNIYDFLSTGEFIDALMEIDLDGFWEENIYELNEVIAVHDELQYIDVYEEIFIKLLTKELANNKDNFIREIDHIVNALISHYNIQDFDYNEFKKRILDCGFNQEDTSQMECLKNKRLSKMF